MTIGEMHYDFKQKWNKIDSQQNRNFKVPEIDWKLNEAYEIFVKSIAEPRVNNHLGFEINQRSIDDIRTVVVNDFDITPVKLSDKVYQVTLPENYMFYVSANLIISRSDCQDRVARAYVRQHDDRFETSPFDDSSFEWKEVNIRFYDGGIKVFTDGTFDVKSFKLNYIRKHAYIHNAQAFLSGSYKMPGTGITLTGTQDCELPDHTHREIVDIAVLVTSGDLASPDYQLKQAKINLNQN